MQKIRAAIIDDEFHGINALRHLLTRYCSEVELVYTTQHAIEAIDGLIDHKPDLLFLDIEMPLLNGIELLHQLDKFSFKVIFTTAYDHYAIQAIKLNALDYLLKPIDNRELRMAVDKYIATKEVTMPIQVSELRRMQHEKVLDTLALSTSFGLSFVKLADIVLLEAISCYTTLLMKDGTRHTVSKTLALFEEVLKEQPDFFRAHKSYIVNLKYIKQYTKGEGGEILLDNGQTICLSRKKKQDFLALFTRI
ncbi:MAG: LytTR family DNA-binding domain-containing protein [Chitinophagaceae bacterium]|jgi:two-component system LytT family response regulator|nr:LytTR family DNA-binding domain-containing protein [Chitinophagaceae bacterium]